MKYRKKPVVVEAIQYNGDNYDEIKKFVGASLSLDWFDVVGGIDLYIMQISTLEGKMQVNNGDYIIKGVEGEFYPCKPDIFEKTYEMVGDDK